MFKPVIHYRESKILTDIDASEMAGKVSKTTNALDIHQLPATAQNIEKFSAECRESEKNTDPVCLAQES
ncbi:hypothetical protein TNCV_641001 [Trichonephila clavipes]|nr:hypothetical protein TNCV_641001 [Trichonephila clavipes]